MTTEAELQEKVGSPRLMPGLPSAWPWVGSASRSTADQP
jgi:hypothetical protein